MYHRLHWKGIIWIVFIIRSFLLSTLPHSTVGLRLLGPRRFFLKEHNPVPSRHPLPVHSSFQALKSSRESSEDGVDDAIMIVRVRSNLGTVKLTIEDKEKATEATIRAGILEELLSKTSIVYKLTQDLSFDPAGVRKIDLSKTLDEQGIQHGCMVYCRMEEETSKDSNKSGANNHESAEINTISTDNSKINEQVKMMDTKKAAKDKLDDVIDLIESSDEEETNNDDDDEVQVVSPQKIRPKPSAYNSTTKNRKRPRTSSDGDSSSTKAVAQDKMGGSHPSFQMASYNVWFGPPDPEARQVFPKERMEGIVESLKVASRNKEREEGERCPLLFVGLQELTPSLVQYIQPLFQSIGYRMCTQPLGGFGPSYGIGIAVPEDLNIVERRFVPYRNSIQGRGFLFVRTSTLLFATTHLESWCGPQLTGSKEREIQIVEVADFCREQLELGKGLELAIIAGDLNWDDERKRKSSEAPNRNLLSILPEGWQDAGTPFDFTYDAKENPMLNGNLRRRFDRCIYMTHPNGARGQIYKSRGLEKIGKESIPNLVWNKKNTYNNTIKKMAVTPSDHFGIVTHFSNKRSS